MELFLRELNRGLRDSRSDAELLALVQQDHGVVAELVARHGNMVWRSCRHLLQAADAEDAFQATFLVLLRSASKIRNGTSLASWLHGVAVRVSLTARRESRRRLGREKTAASQARILEHAPEESSELMVVVHREVAGLSELDRSAFLLCVVEGLTQAEASTRLGRTPGAIAGQVARAKKQLAVQLTKRGTVPWLAGLAALSASSSADAVPSKLLERVLNESVAQVSLSVLRLTQGVVGMTISKKLMVVLGVGLCGVFTASGLGLMASASPQNQSEQKSTTGKAMPPQDEREVELNALKKELNSLQKRVDALSLKDEKARSAAAKVVATTLQSRDLLIPEIYACRIQAQRQIAVRSMASGYLTELTVKEGQSVKKGDILFKIQPILYQAKLDAEMAELRIAQIELDKAKRLLQDKAISTAEVALLEAKFAKAEAKAKFAQAELAFTSIRAPFDGILGHLEVQQGSLSKEGEVLTTLSDNSTVSAYFEMPESRYLEFMGNPNRDKETRQLWLSLANGKKYPHPGKLGAISGQFESSRGTISFRADFPNPDHLLRHGQTANLALEKELKNAITIPQRATIVHNNSRCVYVIDSENVARRRQVVIQNEVDDFFVIKSGIALNDKVVVDGVRLIKEGEKVDYELQPRDQRLPTRK